MEVETISREIIRPWSPTPPENRIYNLSFLDHINPSTYVPILYLYTCDSSDASCSRNIDVSDKLKKSLSKTLARYYPFAGRIRDRVSVDCNDEGVLFVEARVKCKLTEILQNPKHETLDLLLADGLQWQEWSLISSYLAVQVSFFDCGGIAIGVCISHKLADTATMIKFINDWAAIARSSVVHQQDVSSPEFNAASLFPHGDLPLIPEAKIQRGNYTSRRFVFSGSNIAALKAKVADKVHNPTRVELVTALICKSAISASSKSTSAGSSKSSVLVQSVNMRTRTNPPLPESSVGNMSWFFAVPISMGEAETELHDLVGKMKERMTSFSKRYGERFVGEEWPSLIRECLKESKHLFHGGDLVVYRCSSWCRFPIYEADFGWGEPTWVTIGSCVLKNSIMMMDTRNGDGIEAVVNLEMVSMAVFENDLELLQFASLNPSALL
ncbi:hypothetical protein FNV43_RR25843 [Rhamnella rubrinervis]|uniref:Uncharacterized protein n=1 Tax=Rhamnella rubrinervis TaxID=2594499 RepID=A0A8K0GNQ9_9ROSA|nr:hypothetical protein FNV43_RR25843 [Rhamnella rubrinervis]